MSSFERFAEDLTPDNIRIRQQLRYQEDVAKAASELRSLVDEMIRSMTSTLDKEAITLTVTRVLPDAVRRVSDELKQLGWTCTMKESAHGPNGAIMISMIISMPLSTETVVGQAIINNEEH